MLSIEFAKLHVEVAVAGWSRSWQMTTPSAKGRVDAQLETVDGFFAVRGHLALSFSTWTAMARELAQFFCGSLRGGSMTSMVAVSAVPCRRVGLVQPPTATVC